MPGNGELGVWSFARVMLCAIPLLIVFNLLGHNREYVQDLLRGEATTHSEARPGTTPEEQLRGKYDGPDFANFDFLYVCHDVRSAGAHRDVHLWFAVSATVHRTSSANALAGKTDRCPRQFFQPE